MNISDIKMCGLDETYTSELKNLELNTDFSTKNHNKITTDINLNDNEMLFLNNSKAQLDNSINMNNTNPDLNSLYKITNPFLLLLGGKPDNTTRKFDFENKKWSENKSLTVNKFDFSTVMYKEKKILILGGKVTVTNLQLLLIYNFILEKRYGCS